MRIEPRETIAGISMMQVRSLMRWLRDRHFCIRNSDVAAFLQADGSTTQQVISELLARHLIQLHEKFSQEGEAFYVLTEQGARFAAAVATKPLKRATADRILADFLARVEAINSDSYYLFRISRIVLFGSYLGDSPRISDIDLIVHLAPKDNRPSSHKRKCIRRSIQYLHRGWTVSYIDLYGYYETMARREVFVALRNRSAYLSLHSHLDEVVTRNQPHKVLLDDTTLDIPETIRLQIKHGKAITNDGDGHAEENLPLNDKVLH